jgi:hypothetical protein
MTDTFESKIKEYREIVVNGIEHGRKMDEEWTAKPTTDERAVGYHDGVFNQQTKMLDWLDDLLTAYQQEKEDKILESCKIVKYYTDKIKQDRAALVKKVEELKQDSLWRNETAISEEHQYWEGRIDALARVLDILQSTKVQKA